MGQRLIWGQANPEKGKTAVRRIIEERERKEADGDVATADETDDFERRFEEVMG